MMNSVLRCTAAYWLPATVAEKDDGGVRAAIVHHFPGGFQSFPSWREGGGGLSALGPLSKRIAMTAVQQSFFRDLTTKDMSEPERAVYLLKLEREALLRDSKKYHRARLFIQTQIPPGPAQDWRLRKINAEFPKGYCQKELVKINAAIAKAITDLNNHLASNLEPTGQHLNTRKLARQSWRDMR